MSFLVNKAIADAVRAEFENETAILQLGLDTNRSLAGAGAGDTIQFPKFETITEGLETFTHTGYALTPEQLSQSSTEVTIKHVGKAIEIFDENVKYSIAGGAIEDEAKRQLKTVFARALDKEAMDELLGNNFDEVDGTTGLNSNLLLDNIVKYFGEGAFEKAQAVLVHPVVATQLMKDPNFNGANQAGYGNKQFRFEIGKVWGQVPVIMSERVQTDAEGNYKAVAVQKNSLLYALAEDIAVESDRNILQKNTTFSADSYYAVKAVGKSIVFNAK